MNKDTIIKILLGIIALLVFAWVWRIISGMLIGTLIVTTSLLSVLIALVIQIVIPIADYRVRCQTNPKEMSVVTNDAVQ